MSKKNLPIIIFIILVLIGIPLTLFMVKQQQETRSRAECATVPNVSNVSVEYPACQGDQCSFTEASCSWDALADAVSYNTTVTEVETGMVVVDNATQSASTTKIYFPITQQKTYKCDVTATNSCGNTSLASSDQLLCSADAIVSTPTPTAVPTGQPTGQPTSTPMPTATPTAINTPAPTVVVSTATPIPPTTTPIPPTATPTLIPPTPSPTGIPLTEIVQTGDINQTLVVVGISILTIVGGFILFVL